MPSTLALVVDTKLMTKGSGIEKMVNALHPGSGGGY